MKGETNFVADALSRPTVSVIEYDAAINYKDLSKDQASDKELIRLRHSTTSNMKFRLLETFDNVLVWCDISTGRKRPYVTEKYRRKVFNSLHGLGHPSHRATKPLIISLFVWQKMNTDIANWCGYCQADTVKQLKFHVIINQFSESSRNRLRDSIMYTSIWSVSYLIPTVLNIC